MRENPLGRPIRVLSVYPTFWPRQGGGQMVLGAIAQGLSPGIVNTVLTRRLHDTPPRQQYEYLSVERFRNPAPAVWKEYATGVHHVPFWKKSIVTGIDIFCALGPLRRLMAESDLVHLHFPLPLGVSVLLVRAVVKRPLVVTVHGNADVYELPRALEPLTRAVLRRADVVVSVSHDLGRYLRDVMKVPRVTVIPNGVDAEAFRPGHTSRPGLTLFSISRLVPRKNVDVLIAAVGQLVEEGAELLLVIAGTGPEEDRIRRLAGEWPHCVRFLGFIDEARKRSLLAETDVFVQLSTREGLSIAALEALASGVPCVVSNLPGVREPITPGQTGWYVDDPEDVRSVVACLRRVLADRGRLPDMKQACRALAVQRYSQQAMCESYWNVFTDLVQGGA
ncbi:MAG TPA: glycosyltransferase [Vicinamibacterales bacterium]|nr:glycosyltransferase [Vicinamibacterales bacterium]